MSENLELSDRTRGVGSGLTEIGIGKKNRFFYKNLFKTS